MNPLKISVLGCGRWGTFLAWYACNMGHEVYLWGRENSINFAELAKDRSNEYLTLQAGVNLTHSLTEAVAFGEFIIIAISAQHLREFAKQISLLKSAKKAFILCMKGLEVESGKRLSQVFAEELGSNSNVAIWVGPGHVQDFLKGIPNCMVIGSNGIELTKNIVENLGSDLIRFYYGQDLIGNEVGAAAKNVIGIAAGMLDGLGYSSLKGALMARGAREVARLVRAMGGNELTVYGLSHLGDYEATLFSSYSHNRRFGELYVKGDRFEKLAEGVATVQALKYLSDRHEVDLPICNAVHSIVSEGKNPAEILVNLFVRPIRFEF